MFPTDLAGVGRAASVRLPSTSLEVRPLGRRYLILWLPQRSLIKDGTSSRDQVMQPSRSPYPPRCSERTVSRLVISPKSKGPWRHLPETSHDQWAPVGLVFPAQPKAAMACPLSRGDRFRSSAIPPATRLLLYTSLSDPQARAEF